MNNKPSQGTMQSQIGWWCVWALVFATVLVALRQPPEVMTDAGHCMLAAEQHYQRENLEFHTLIQADPKDLQGPEVSIPITWWPASYSFLPYLGRLSGLNWGRSLQLIFLIGWSLGVWGWTCFFRRLLSPAILPWAVAAFLVFRYTHANANVYDGGEFLFWSLFPWILLVNLHAMQTSALDGWRSATTVTLAAVVTVLLVLVKYSAGLSALGIAVAWVVVAFRYQVPRNRLCFWVAGAVLGVLLVIPGGLLPSGNPSNVGEEERIQWTALCWAPGAWTFAITDLESLVARLLISDRQTSLLPAIGRFGDGQIAWLTPVTLGLLLGLWYRLRRERHKVESLRAWNPLLPFDQRTLIRAVVVVHLITFSVVLSGLILAGSKIHMDARFLRPAAIAFLPWLLVGIVQAIRSSSFPTRLVGVATLGLFIVIPALYGAATATSKTVVRGSAAAARTGPLGIRHDLLGKDGNAKRFYENLKKLQKGPTTTYYLLEHALALPLAEERILIEHAHLRTREHLASKQYKGIPEDGVILVVPGHFEDNGKLATIQGSFIDIKEGHWETSSLKSQPNWLVSISRPRFVHPRPSIAANQQNVFPGH
ncbi:MAG TPA: hypothetical protein EYN70_01300 [Planctomycetaceae bacterium]|nr:hypothetical protein [Planctomycetaceae bacterium]